MVSLVIIFCMSAVMIASGSTLSIPFEDMQQQQLLLKHYPMIMSHDAVSGELDEARDFVVTDWTRTQGVGLIGQLDCGSRSFDYRPYLSNDGVLYGHHGGVVVYKTMRSSVVEVVDWCNSNPDDLVILYVTDCEGDDGCLTQVRSLLDSLNVYTISDCSVLSTLTYAKAQFYSRLRKGGSLLALIGCVSENYDPSINCYGPSFVCYDSWPTNSSAVPWKEFSNYMSAVTSVDPTTNSSGSAAYSNNLWMAQGHWQSTAVSISLGTLHNSSVLLDESRSGVNEWVRESIYQRKFDYLNLLELDNVCNHGLEIYQAIQDTYLTL